MKISREQIYKALFDTVTAAVTNAAFISAVGVEFKTISRKLRLWSEVPPAEQPALFQTQIREVAVYDGRGVPIKWELFVDITFYVYGGPGANDSTAPFINATLDAITAALPTGAPAFGTLGLSSVSEARIFGDVLVLEGDISGQGIAIVPIRIVAH